MHINEGQLAIGINHPHQQKAQRVATCSHLQQAQGQNVRLLRMAQEFLKVNQKDT